MKKILCLVIIMMLSTISEAKINIVSPTHFDLGNGANISIIENQTIDDNGITLQPQFQPILQIRINGSNINYSSISDKSLWNMSYNFSADKWDFNVSSIADPLNMTATMRRFNVKYNLSEDSLVIAENTSDLGKRVIFTFEDWTVNQHNLIIEVNSSSILLYNIKGYILNRVNESVINANVTELTIHNYDRTDMEGYYLLSGFEPGNYTIRSQLYPYANKTITNIEIFNTDKIINFTMGVVRQQKEEDNTPIFIIVIFILLILYGSKTKKFNDIKDFISNERKNRRKNEK